MKYREWAIKFCTERDIFDHEAEIMITRMIDQNFYVPFADKWEEELDAEDQETKNRLAYAVKKFVREYAEENDPFALYKDNFSSSTVRDWFMDFCTERGMSISDAEGVFKMASEDDVNRQMKHRWDERLDRQPQNITGVLSFTTKKIALRYIDEHKPKAFYRAMFE